MKYIFVIILLLTSISCTPDKPTWVCYPKVHVIGCSYCGYETRGCLRTAITFQNVDGQLMEVYEHEGFKCDLYNRSTYWELHVARVAGDDFTVENDVVAKRMVK